MIFAVVSMLLFVIGFIVSFGKKGGYAVSSVASVFAFIGGLAGLQHSYVIFDISLFDKLSLVGAIDHLSAIFLIFSSVSWFSISLFSIDYGYNHGKTSAAFINMVFLGMFFVIVAGDAITLLCGWELMTLFAFLMILSEKEVRFKDAFPFMAFGELSTVSLLIGFAFLYLHSHSTSFEFISSGGKYFIIFTSIGFLIKMDIIPFHTWMKKVYSKAPTNVCAILSGPVTLMGVYGIIRVFKFSFVNLNEWYIIVLFAIGGLSVFWGALHAVATGGLRTLPAYSTVENNGLILASVAFSFLVDNSYLSHFAFAAALMVAFGHLLAKSLLFISIGHAKEAYNALTIDEVKGVWKGVGKIPALGIVVSGLSLSAFPPLIGYVSEWMVLESVFQSFKFINNFYRFFGTFVGILIALGMGLTGFAMAKLIGYTALGYHHDKKIKKFSDSFIKTSEILLILFVTGCGCFAPFLFKISGYSFMLGGALGVPKPFLIMSGNPIFGVISPTFLFIVIGVLSLFPFSIYFVTKKRVRKVNSFNGALPLQDGEYFTAKGFSYILEHILAKVYRTRETLKDKEFIMDINDICIIPYNFFRKMVITAGKITGKVLMNGKIYWYILYIFLIFLLCFFIVNV